MVINNICSKCGRNVEHKMLIVTNREQEETLGHGDYKIVTGTERILEYWCFNCIRAKILWPAPDRNWDTKRKGRGLGLVK